MNDVLYYGEKVGWPKFSLIPDAVFPAALCREGHLRRVSHLRPRCAGDPLSSGGDRHQRGGRRLRADPRARALCGSARLPD